MRKFSDSARKTNPHKLRFTPQVSAAFASVSILIDANRVDPDCDLQVVVQHIVKILCDTKSIVSA
jgi:hypothetical protein